MRSVYGEGHGQGLRFLAASALLAQLERRAREQSCALVDLDSGVDRHNAHRLYFREAMSISAFHFTEPL